MAGCGGKKTDETKGKIAEGYEKYRDNALWKSLEPPHKEILQICSEKENDSGATSDDLMAFKQTEVDRLIALRLILLDPENKRYQLTTLGKDLFLKNNGK